MTGSKPILIQAVVTAAEQAAVRDAAERLSASLSAAAGTAYAVDCVFPTDIDRLDRSGKTSIVITSLLDEVDAVDERWQETEDRLRSTYRNLSEDGRLAVFICTVLRHVAPDAAPELVTARRIRIRRLNLLAAELSRETGCFVIDVDRMLADIGAQPLQTDYRLIGPYAAGAAAKSIAMTLLSAGLDAFVPVEIQDAARDLVAAYQPPRAAAVTIKAKTAGVYSVASRSAGRRTQTVVPVVHIVDESQVDLQLRRLMRGQIGTRRAVAMFIRSVHQRGLRSTVTRSIAGIARYVRNHALPSKQG
jgi:hypothetical protein